MLTDAGALVAILDDDDSHHEECAKFAAQLPAKPLLTTWACFTEAMYLVGAAGGFPFQDELWGLRRDGKLSLLDISDDEADRMYTLMEQYADVPMDLADASLVAVAEARGFRQLFTVDSDFYIYRLADGTVLEKVP
jgi:predicted nucleic acid-binding protein